MVSCQKVCALGNAHVRADGDFPEAVEPCALADPDMIAELQVPRILHIDSRLDHHAAADPRPENAQQAALEIGATVEPGVEEKGVDQVPDSAACEPSPRVVTAIVVTPQIDLHRRTSSRLSGLGSFSRAARSALRDS